MPTIFINYRREESSGEARALFKDLVAALGDDAVFMDVDSIAPGQDFRDVVQQRLAACDLMLSLVGREWLTVTTRDGRRRLDDPADFVRLEIEAALKRRIPVAPVLLNGTPMPPADSLPESLRDFAFRNAFELSHTRWESDVDEMMRRLGLMQAATPHAPHPAAGRAPASARADTVTPSPSGRTKAVVGVLALVIVIAAAGFFYRGTKPTVASDQNSAEAEPLPAAREVTTPPPDAPSDAPSEKAASAVDTPERTPAAQPEPVVDAAPRQEEAVETESARGGLPPIGARLELGSQLTGPGSCLERLTIQPCVNRPAQRWTFESVGDDGRLRVHNVAAGPRMCLDVLNEGDQSQLTLAECGDYSGQWWRVTAAGPAGRLFQLRNDFTGADRCLAAVNRRDNAAEIRMASCANAPAQRWRVVAH